MRSEGASREMPFQLRPERRKDSLTKTLGGNIPGRGNRLSKGAPKEQTDIRLQSWCSVGNREQYSPKVEK